MNIILQLADKYGVEYTLEQAVLVANWRTLLRELKEKLKKFNYVGLDYNYSAEEHSEWRHFLDPCVPSEIIEIIGYERAYDLLGEHLRHDYEFFYEELDSGDFWRYQESLRPEIKEFILDYFKEVEFDNYNYFRIIISLPYLAEIMDCDLVDMLAYDEVDSEIEDIEKEVEFIKKVDGYNDNILVDMLKDLERQGYDINNILGIPYWESWECHIKNYNKSSVIQSVVKDIFENMIRIKLLNEQLGDALRLNELAYEALEAAVECVTQFLKDVETTYEDVYYWIEEFEANGMEKEAKQIRNILGKQKKKAC